jgi:hypothetical protein
VKQPSANADGGDRGHPRQRLDDHCKLFHNLPA